MSEEKPARLTPKDARNLAEVVGALCLVVAAGWIWPPAALIVLGAALILAAEFWKP